MNLLLAFTIIIALIIIVFLEIKRNKKSKNNNTIQDPYPNDGLSDNYLFDFKNYQSQFSTNNVPTISEQSIELTPSIKIKVKPIDVLNELETIPTPFSLELLDEKIIILKDKERIIVQKYAKREVSALIERLNNRKKYIEFKCFFDLFQNTTDEKIDLLLSKYDLVMRSSDIFIPEFPNEAIQIMSDYTQQTEKLCGKKPLFYVIATEENFAEKYKKRDPILLVQSPFGFYWQILGAWDKEMILLSEL